MNDYLPPFRNPLFLLACSLYALFKVLGAFKSDNLSEFSSIFGLIFFTFGFFQKSDCGVTERKQKREDEGLYRWFRNVDPYCLGKNMYTKITVGAE